MESNDASNVWVKHDGIYIISDENDTVWCILESYGGGHYYSGSGATVADALRHCAAHVDSQDPEPDNNL